MVESREQLLLKIKELEDRLEESEQLITAIKAGEVDAFAIYNEERSEVYTLQSGDYAYRVLIEEFDEGALNVTEDGLIVYSNPYFAKLLHLPYEEVIGANIFDFVDGDSRGEFEELFKESLNRKSKGEINLQIRNRAIPVYISLTSLRPKLATVGIIITDLTDKKKSEYTILEYQKDLESKNSDLSRSNSELDSFAYIASHDLQEPLRKIQTFSSRLLEKEYANLSQNGKDQFARMQLSAKRMQMLIEDLLSYSRTNAVERKFENVYLNELVEEVKVELGEEIQRKEGSVEVNGTCQIHVIVFQFRQLLQNLISNSLKFSDPSRPPKILIESEMITYGGKPDVQGLKSGVRYCHITITDNGIGFEQEYSERIFELFQRLHGKDAFQGTGIGLAIVKKIVENHNGIIKARSEVDQGAIFDIYIPAAD